jgi:ABC-type nickel/cobalt efflux system permease component RcnA
MTTRNVILSLLLFMMMLLGGQAHAQQAQPKPTITIDRSRLLVPPKNPDGTISVTPFTESPVQWARDEQQRFYSAMNGAMKQLRGDAPWHAGLTLMLLSFAYGVFHAAGPGHGKAVISGWLLATESQLRRGILIAFMSAIFQALSAILLVGVPLLLVAGAADAARSAAGVLESASFALIAGMGAYLIYTALRPLLAARPQAIAMAVPAQSRRAVLTGVQLEIVSPRIAADHVHGPDCGCGHAHVPTAAAVRDKLSLRQALSLSLAVGLRPCTGALLVLLFANVIGLYWAGIASTFAMAIGTFLTVSAIAALTVFSKSVALRYAGRDSRWTAFGGLMFVASLYGPVGGM